MVSTTIRMGDTAAFTVADTILSKRLFLPSELVRGSHDHDSSRLYWFIKTSCRHLTGADTGADGSDVCGDSVVLQERLGSLQIGACARILHTLIPCAPDERDVRFCVNSNGTYRVCPIEPVAMSCHYHIPFCVLTR